MKTITRVIKERPEYRSLIEAVVRNIDKENIPDINSHGIDGGYGNFIYYYDTVKFWRKHRKKITQLAEEQWEDFGYMSTVDMISSFKCCQGERASDIAKALYGNYNDEYDTIYNCLAWYAAEEVCRWFEE